LGTPRIRCQVLEVPDHEEWLQHGRGAARDLLPWADPYIARLMHRLEDRYATDGADRDSSDPFADGRFAQRENFDPPSASWQDDAFMPRPLEAPRCRWHGLVCGGFPLLDDGSEDDGAEENSHDG